MKILILLLALLMASCSTNNYIKDYDNTNPVKIEQATTGLEVNDMIPSNLDGSIAVRSIELDLNNHLDMGVIYMIEDHLITNLIKNKYKVLERDPEALSNLYRESSSNYMKYIDQSFNFKDSEDSKDSESSEAVNVIVNVSDQNLKSDESDKLDESDKTDELVNTDLHAADYMLSYRVLECGVIYTALDDSESKSTSNLNKLKRSARTRLHCRLTNTKTSEIISAGIVENEISDIINRDDVIDLEQISYQYYHHTLPLQNTYGLTEDSGYALVNEDRPIQAASKNPKKASGGIVTLAVAGFLFLMIFGN